MSRLIVAVVLLALVPQLGSAQDKKDPLADLLAKLRKPADLAPGETLNLAELALFIQDKYGVPVTMNATAITVEVGEGPATLMLELPKVKGLPLGVTLRHVLADKQATFLVRKTHIEIVPISVAAKEAKLTPDEDGILRLTHPLVSAMYKEKPLNEAMADLAEEHDLTIVVAPQAADNKAAFVTARFLNVPANQAIELLALQADLRVVKKGATYFITSKEHAAELFNEALERKKQKKEVDLLGGFPFGVGGGGGVPAPQPEK